MAKKVADQPAANTNHNHAEDAVLALNVAKLLAADILLDESKADYKAIKDHVSGKGVNLKAYALARKVVKSDKVSEYVTLFCDTLQILKILGKPANPDQFELLVAEDPYQPLDDRASEEGRYAGIMCLPIHENPYSIDSSAGQAWQKAYGAGEEERKLIMALEPDEHSDLIKGDDPFADTPAEAAE
jgi:hypothetical protein